MSEIEKMKRYIDRTGAEKGLTDKYSMRFAEIYALISEAGVDGNTAWNVITLAFKYGKAKGYRAAKAEALR